MGLGMASVSQNVRTNYETDLYAIMNEIEKVSNPNNI